MSDNTLEGGAGNDNIVGNDGADTLIGGIGVDSLIGGKDADILIGGAGADDLFGGNDIDTASYVTATAAVTVNLISSSLNTGDAKGDLLNSIEIGSTAAFQ